MWITNQARCYIPSPMPGAYAETVTNSAMFASVSGGSSPTARAGTKGTGENSLPTWGHPPAQGEPAYPDRTWQGLQRGALRPASFSQASRLLTGVVAVPPMLKACTQA
jgi:hypothetical protein